MPYRSAITGRYLSKASAARHPKTSLHESSASNPDTSTHHRSAVSGRYVTAEAARRSPKNTVTENR